MQTKYNHLSTHELVMMHRHDTPTPELIEEMWNRLEATVLGAARKPVFCAEDD